MNSFDSRFLTDISSFSVKIVKIVEIVKILDL